MANTGSLRHIVRLDEVQLLQMNVIAYADAQNLAERLCLQLYAVKVLYTEEEPYRWTSSNISEAIEERLEAAFSRIAKVRTPLWI